jgi:hypothetical protein
MPGNLLRVRIQPHADQGVIIPGGVQKFFDESHDYRYSLFLGGSLAAICVVFNIFVAEEDVKIFLTLPRGSRL